VPVGKRYDTVGRTRSTRCGAVIADYETEAGASFPSAAQLINARRS
jgi:hypothetical protein